jgi:uncharacterized membrane protein
MTERVQATSDSPTPEDKRLRGILTGLISEQNSSMIDVAQKMLTITFTGIGVALAIQEKWFGGSPQSDLARGLVLASLITLLCSVPIYLGAIKVQSLAVTRNDYESIEDELIRLAQVRRRLVNVGMLMTSLAAAILIIATTQ